MKKLLLMYLLILHISLQSSVLLHLNINKEQNKQREEDILKKSLLKKTINFFIKNKSILTITPLFIYCSYVFNKVLNPIQNDSLLEKIKNPIIRQETIKDLLNNHKLLFLPQFSSIDNMVNDLISKKNILQIYLNNYSTELTIIFLFLCNTAQSDEFIENFFVAFEDSLTILLSMDRIGYNTHRKFAHDISSGIKKLIIKMNENKIFSNILQVLFLTYYIKNNISIFKKIKTEYPEKLKMILFVFFILRAERIYLRYFELEKVKEIKQENLLCFDYKITEDELNILTEEFSYTISKNTIQDIYRRMKSDNDLEKTGVLYGDRSAIQDYIEITALIKLIESYDNSKKIEENVVQEFTEILKTIFTCHLYCLGHHYPINSIDLNSNKHACCSFGNARTKMNSEDIANSIDINFDKSFLQDIFDKKIYPDNITDLLSKHKDKFRNCKAEEKEDIPNKTNNLLSKKFLDLFFTLI